MTSTAVEARVVDETVRSSAGATDVSRRTSAVVTGDQVRASAAIKTRP